MAHQSKLYSHDSVTQLLSLKQSNTSIPASDIKGISKAIYNYYKLENERRNPLVNLPKEGYKDGYPFFFEEVKSLRLVSFSGTEARVSADMLTHSYELHEIETSPSRFIIRKSQFNSNRLGHYDFVLVKINGKWKSNR
jgi:hypothetical protein